MSNEPNGNKKEQHGIPTAVVRRRRLSWTWLVPIIAIGVVGYLVWSQVAREKGTMISIRFVDAGGLEPGSEIVHRGVTVGVVRAVSLAPDQSGVDVQAELVPSAQQLAVEGTQFWVVRARVSLGGIAGLDTLIGPRYIALQPGSEEQPAARSFVALADAPVAEPTSDGSLHLVLRSDRLGTLSPGNPVFYREIRVGTVRDATLTDDSTAVLINIEIEPRYAPLIRTNTRFWRSGGVGFDFGLFSGLNVQADSLEAALSASVSLATPEKRTGDRVGPGVEFELADSVDEDWLKWSPRIQIRP
jgi:paraquat-inducible protein B